MVRFYWASFERYLHSKVTEVLTLNVTLPNIRSIWVGRRYVPMSINLYYRLIGL
jgi:hypothetical protein